MHTFQWKSSLRRILLGVLLFSWSGFCIEWLFDGYQSYCLVKDQITLLEEEKERLSLEISYFESMIEKCNDPSYVEKLLIEKLGMVPDGMVKVIFPGEGYD